MSNEKSKAFRQPWSATADFNRKLTPEVTARPDGRIQNSGFRIPKQESLLAAKNLATSATEIPGTARAPLFCDLRGLCGESFVLATGAILPFTVAGKSASPASSSRFCRPPRLVLCISSFTGARVTFDDPPTGQLEGFRPGALRRGLSHYKHRTYSAIWIDLWGA